MDIVKSALAAGLILGVLVVDLFAVMFGGVSALLPVFAPLFGKLPDLRHVLVSGGDPQRVTFQGDYNARASMSYDGKKLALAQGNGNVYRISVLDKSFGEPGQFLTLSPGSLDESPSFAPNASMILYATKQGRRGVLYAVSADGRVRQRLVLSDGDVREPAWSPYR